ncbi:MAG: FHA domain-containing protein [Chloroflexales bacterium]|nr:FHA domain-containing protein [Chloroflexales bacterium]
MKGLYLLLALLVIAGLTSLGAQPISAQEPRSIEITSIDTSRYPEVTAYVAVSDGQLPAPSTLQAQENGVPITQISAVQPITTGVALAVVIDLTRSMRGQGMPGSASRLTDAISQTLSLVYALNPTFPVANPISVIAFHRDVQLVLPLDRERADGSKVGNLLSPSSTDKRIPTIFPKNRLVSAANDLADPNAKANLSGAIDAALDELTLKAEARQQKVIVVFGDSCDDMADALIENKCATPDVPGPMLEKLRRYAGTVSIFAVGLGDDEQDLGPLDQEADAGFSYRARFEQLRAYAAVTTRPPGSFVKFFAQDPTQADAVRQTFAEQVAGPIQARRVQLAITYISDSAVTQSSGEISLTVGDGVLSATRPFTVPTLIPIVNLLSSLPPGKHTLEVDIPPDHNPIAITAADRQEAPPSGPVAPAPVTTTTPDARPGNGISPSLLWLFGLFVLVLLLGLVILRWIGRQPQRAEPRVLRETLPIPHGDQAIAQLPQADYVLMVRYGATPGKEYPLLSERTIIGANEAGVDLLLNDPYVTGQHAIIERQSNQLRVVDLGSSNGTCINNKRLAVNVPHLLNPGDLLTLGRITLQLLRSDTSESYPVGTNQMPASPLQPEQSKG